VQSSQIALQNGSGTLNFTTATSEPVAIAITNSSGQQIYGTTLTSTAGQNTWTWNGQDNNGNQLPDGAYNVAVVAANADGSTTAVPFTVTGTATGVQSLSSGMQLQLGALSVPFSAVQSVGN
jgi:flagellar basal-body rod modification protein FlgD